MRPCEINEAFTSDFLFSDIAFRLDFLSSVSVWLWISGLNVAIGLDCSVGFTDIAQQLTMAIGLCCLSFTGL